MPIPRIEVQARDDGDRGLPGRRLRRLLRLLTHRIRVLPGLALDYIVHAVRRLGRNHHRDIAPVVVRVPAGSRSTAPPGRARRRTRSSPSTGSLPVPDARDRHHLDVTLHHEIRPCRRGQHHRPQHRQPGAHLLRQRWFAVPRRACDIPTSTLAGPVIEAVRIGLVARDPDVVSTAPIRGAASAATCSISAGVGSPRPATGSARPRAALLLALRVLHAEQSA